MPARRPSARRNAAPAGPATPKEVRAPAPSARSAPAAAPRGAAVPRIVVNAKAYAEATGADGVRRLAEACAALPGSAGVALAVPAVELAWLARTAGLRLPLYAQHCDAREPGAATGWVTAEALAAAGAAGSLVNHAEHKLPHAEVAAVVKRLHAAGLASLVCADSLAEAKALAAFRPAMLAVEPPELIGGDVSVTSADPAIVSDAVKAVRKVSPSTRTLCGAGVKTGADVAAALKLGAHGVLLASGVVKAKDQAAALRDLAKGLR